MSIVRAFAARPPATVTVAIIVQFFAVAVLIFGDIGFDKPGRYGLDFDHGILLALLYVVAFGFGVILCLVKRRWLPLAAQMVVPLLFVVYLVVLAPTPRLDASQYQHLVGKTQDEARAELRGFRVWTAGA